MTAAEVLDRAFFQRSTDRDISAMVSVGRELEALFAVPAPKAHVTKAAFVEGVRTSQRTRRLRYLTGAIAGATAACMTLLLVARDVSPDGTFFSVRRALGSFGLTSSVIEQADGHVDAAATALERAEQALLTNPSTADRFALLAISDLGMARALLEDLDSIAASVLRARIAGLEGQAKDVIRSDSRGGKAGPADARTERGQADEKDHRPESRPERNGPKEPKGEEPRASEPGSKAHPAAGTTTSDSTGRGVLPQLPEVAVEKASPPRKSGSVTPQAKNESPSTSSRAEADV